MQYLVENLTPEQMSKLIQIADPLTEQQKQEFDSMSDEELLAELGVEV